MTTEALNFRLATGNVGVMAATNEDVAAAEKPMLALVFGSIIILCLITYRSSPRHDLYRACRWCWSPRWPRH